MKNSDMPEMPLAVNEDEQGRWWSGLTKREHFAALAMQGFCAAPDTSDWSTEHLAQASIRQADALLAALEEKGND